MLPPGQNQKTSSDTERDLPRTTYSPRNIASNITKIEPAHDSRSKAWDPVNYLKSSFLNCWAFSAERFIEWGASITGVPLHSDYDMALITGGSGGLGLEIVQQFQLLNIKTFILDIVPPPQMVFGNCEIKSNTNVFYYPCDISNPKEIAELHKKIKLQHGNVTILINNAGITSGYRLQELSDKVIEKTIQVNYVSAFYTIQEFLPDMVSMSRGYIVNVASVLGFMSPARLTAYGASKGGLISLHEALVNELYQIKRTRPQDSLHNLSPRSKIPIKALLVCPGKIKTPLFQAIQTPSSVMAPDLDPSYLASEIIKAIECNRTGILRLPYYVNIITLFKGLSWPYVRLFRYLSGIDGAMERFHEGQ